MNKQTLQQKLRSLINEACPELLELEFGCKVHHNRTEGLVIKRFGESEDNKGEEDKWSIYWNGGNYNISTYEIEDIEIIGKEPTLSHLLRAIDKKNPHSSITIRTSGFILQEFDYNLIICKYNLELPPLEQSEEVLTSLIELLS